MATNAAGVEITGCPKHKLLYRWYDGSWLCMHPECLEGLVVSHCRPGNANAKFLSMIDEVGGRDDFIQHLACELVARHATGKLYGFGGTVLFYIISDYCRRILRNDRWRAQVELPQGTDSIHDQQLAEALQEAVVNMGNDLTEITDPQRAAICTEIMQYAASTMSEAMLLAMTDQITGTELFKICRAQGNGMPLPDLLEQVEWLATWLRSWAQERQEV